MATVGQIYYNVIDKRTRSCTSSGTDIFNDIVKGRTFTKVGIQAQPGTKVVMGTDNTGTNNKTIMIGITGTYELDDDIAIKSMKFIRPLKYELKVDESNQAMKDGAQMIKKAEDDREAALQTALANYGVGGVPPSDPSQSTFTLYWNEFNRIQTQFLEDYNKGLDKYQSGINGIYKLPHEDMLEHPDNYDDLYNVIIDFIYE